MMRPSWPDWGPASLVLIEVSTLYFETDAGDGFREPGFSKERRPEPQITLGLLTDAACVAVDRADFEGIKAETATTAADPLPDDLRAALIRIRTDGEH